MRRLLIRPGALGDCVLSLPAMRCLRAEYTEVWCPEAYRWLFSFANQTRSIQSTGLDLMGLPGVTPPPALLGTLRSFNEIVSWTGSKQPEMQQAMREVGVPIHFLPPLPETATHVAEHLLQQARTLQDCADKSEVGFPVVSRRGGFAVIHPFSSSKQKNWPLAHFRRLADWLSTLVPVRWCAGPEELLAGAVRLETIEELAWWLAGSRLFIGNDSGPGHLAAACGVPTVTLMGPMDPEQWSPRGPHVAVVATDSRKTPMETISLERVQAAVLSLLGSSCSSA